MKWSLSVTLLLLPTLARAADFGVDATSYDGPAWSPYLVGAGIGVLSWLTFYFSDKPIGASSFYATVAGFIGKMVAHRHTESLQYYQSNPPSVNWGFVFVLFTILGGFIVAWTGGEIRNEWLHPMCVDRFGDSMALRGGVGFCGGVLMAFGARIAGGCTSGHGISGTLSSTQAHGSPPSQCLSVAPACSLRPHFMPFSMRWRTMPPRNIWSGN